MPGFGMGLRQIQRCELCGQSADEHAEDCPQLRLDRLYEQQLMILCPECKEVAVGVNAHDTYECRKCHSQFSRGAHNDHGQRRVVLDDPREHDLIMVVLLEAKGDGRFPIDDHIADQLKIIEQALEQADTE